MNEQHGDLIQRTAAGTSVTEAIVGLVASVLAIIGLARIFPWLLASVSTIAMGAALMFEAGAVGARFSAVAQGIGETERMETWGRWGSMTAGFLLGCAGIALGILALIGIARTVLIPVSAIVYGAALTMDSGIRMRLSALESEHFGLHGAAREVAYEAAAASSGIQVLAGMGGLTLGILAIIGIDPLTLSLVALLSMGSIVLVVGSLVGGRMMGVRRSLRGPEQSV